MLLGPCENAPRAVTVYLLGSHGLSLRLWTAGGTGSEDDVGGILKVERLDAFGIREISLWL